MVNELPGAGECSVYIIHVKFGSSQGLAGTNALESSLNATALIKRLPKLAHRGKKKKKIYVVIYFSKHLKQYGQRLWDR